LTVLDVEVNALPDHVGQVPYTRDAGSPRRAPSTTVVIQTAHRIKPFSAFLRALKVREPWR
jgi:hypothetical protein